MVGKGLKGINRARVQKGSTKETITMTSISRELAFKKLSF